MATQHSSIQNLAVDFGVTLLKLICRLPRPAGLWFGRTLGRLTATFSKDRRYVCRTNATLCFPNLTVTQREAFVTQVFENNGMGLIETGWAWWADPAPFWETLEVEGQEHLDAALSRGKGVLLIGGHYSALDLGGLLFAKIAPRFAATYRPHNFQRLENELQAGRGRFMDLIDRNDIRGIFKALDNNQIVWFAPDQDLGGDHAHVFADFFGVPAATNPGLRKMARRGAVPLSISFHRLPAGGYRLTLIPWPDVSEFDDLAFAQRMNQVIEEQVQRAPDQYMWVHRRFKTRPEGEGSLY